MPTQNDEIRAKILRIHYDLEMNQPSSHFDTDALPKLMPDVPQNLLDANLLYLCESRLISGNFAMGRRTPIGTRITPAGTNVVERPNLAGQFALDIKVLNVNTNYGQIAQATAGTISQTLTVSSFDDLRRLLQIHPEVKGDERQEIESVLNQLEKDANQKNLTQKMIDEAKRKLAKYGWILAPLT